MSGKVVVPGFIDTHFHVESSLMPPQEFERCVLPHGVTTGICDPHEMANVLGTDAFAWFLESVRDAGDGPAGAALLLRPGHRPSRDLRRSDLRRRPPRRLPAIRKVIGLAEFMNFPGRAGRRSGCSGEASGLPGTAHRRPRAAAARLRSERLHRGRHPHGARGDDARGGAGEALQGNDRADPRGLGLQGSARARADPHRAHGAVPGLLHRRPESARHRRGGPSRLRRSAPRSRSARRRWPPTGRPRGRRPGPSACTTAGWSRPASAPISSCSTTWRPAPYRAVFSAGRPVDDALFAGRPSGRADRPRQRAGAPRDGGGFRSARAPDPRRR